ncbi:PBP1A family penicillin-binding protein [Candidatus Dependentiae bacterium]|nr:PBP1A family penicillin-binding protein [Candidatus Dependentiae bacterium]
MIGSIFYLSNYPWVDFSNLEYYNPGKPSIVLDDEGKELMRFAIDKREVVTINEMPKHLIDAFISAEDHNFFNHGGISFKGILRSTLINLYNRKIVQGASTITQQLVKLIFYDSKKSFKRKIKEQFLALILEKQFTKYQIMERYLNHICFGYGIYGVEAASQRFWGKSVRDISVDEAATLAAIVKNPQYYCPLRDTNATEKRRNVVLYSMNKLGYINNDQYSNTKNNQLIIQLPDKNENLCLKETLRNFLESIVGKKQLYTDGYVIQTTINSNAQKEGQQIFSRHCARQQKILKCEIDGGLIALETDSGNIKAIVGGAENFSYFNRALNAKRQMGSIFKPVIYAAAIEKGISFAHTDIDEETIFAYENHQYAPKNFNHKFEGEMTLAYALSKSNNIVAVKTLLNVGSEKVTELAKKFGIENISNKYPSLALGCIDTTLIQASAMFNVFANNGKYVKPVMVLWIKDQLGKKIWKEQFVKREAIDSRTSSKVAKVLSASMERLKKIVPEKWIQSDSIGKTGTTNDARTCWFVGSTKKITTAVYIGSDDNGALGNEVYATRTALPIWLEFNNKIEVKKESFNYDPRLTTIYIHEKTGQIVTENDENAFPILV